MKAADFAISRILPEDLRQPEYDLSKKGVSGIMAQVAAKYPEQFGEIAKKLGDLGRNAAWYQGYTTGAADTRPVIDTQAYYLRMDAELAHLRKQQLPVAEFEEQRNEILLRYSDAIDKDTMKAALGSNNAFAKAVASGARGNPAHVKAILSTPGIYSDSNGNVIPLFVRNSFSQGLRPAETLAGTYGARLAVTSTKKATAKGGDLAKILTQSTSNYNVTEKDCGVNNGIDLTPDDESLSGRVLARPLGGLPAGTVLDNKALGVIRRQTKPAVVRSAMTCQSEHGLCARCAGVQADGKFPKIGESIGITAGHAISEPIVQGSLNTKHCLYVGDTEVLMATGERKMITDVEPGDKVLGVGGEGRNVTRVKAVVDQGIQDVSRYEFALPGGRNTWASISSTDCHQVLTEDGKKEIGKTDHILLPREIAFTGGRREEWAFFAGFYMGDGIRLCSGKAQSLRISCAEETTAQELNAYLLDRGSSLKKRKRSHDWAVVQNLSGTTRRDPKTGRVLGSPPHPAKELIRRLGWLDCYAHEKTVPDEVWTWDTESVAAFVSGFLTADGSVYQLTPGGAYGVALSSTSRDMVVRLQQLLWSRLGVFSSTLTKTADGSKEGRNNSQWQFTVTRRAELSRLLRYLAPMGPKLLKVQAAGLSAGEPATGPVCARLISVTPLGRLPCADITVEADNELFSLSNGAVVKNTGGQAKGGKKSFSGFDYISQFVQVPDDFRDRAAVSELSGMVEKVEEAPQGGHHITVNGQQHFALPGFAATVKVGDNVEAGDQLSEGLVNPADIVRLRGLGEGRRYYAERLGQILSDSGNPPDKRNMEIIARATIDTYRTDDPDADSDYMPDESVRASSFMKNYKPPVDTVATRLDKASGGYLQQPVLHYSIGTQLTPKMVERMRGAGVEEVMTSKTTPWFKPEMKRLRVASHDSKDWLVSLGTSYLSGQMRDALERGDETDVRSNYHFGPRLAFGADAGSGVFGENIEATGKF